MMKLGFALLILFTQTTQVFAQSDTSCDCPAVDSKANTKCGPTPAKLDKEEFAKACKASEIAPQTVKTTVAALDRSKSIKSTLDYMSCYRSSKSQFCHFKTTLGPLINLAAKSSNLPFAVQSCLFKRESQFTADILSPAGALGYVQFMPGTSEVINNIVKGDMSRWASDQGKAITDIAAQNEAYANAKSNYQRSIIKSKLNAAEARLRSARAKIEARKVWNEYWEGTENAPKSATHKMVQCPNVAFAMSAAKQVYDLYYMRKIDVNEHEDGVRTINEMDATDSAIFLAGSYNIGQGTFATMCGNSKTLENCKAQFSKKSETYRHMVSVENCAKKDSFDAMPGTKTKDCGAYQCGNI